MRCNHIWIGNLLYSGYPRCGTPSHDPPTYKEAGAGAPAPTYQPPREWGMIFHVRWISDEIQSYISYAASRHISYLSNPRLDKYFIAIASMIFSPAGTQVQAGTRKNPAIASQSPAFLYHSKSPLSFLAKIFPDISCGLRGVLQGRFCYNRDKRGIPRLFSTEGRMSYGQRTRRAQARTVIPLL